MSSSPKLQKQFEPNLKVMIYEWTSTENVNFMPDAFLFGCQLHFSFRVDPYPEKVLCIEKQGVIKVSPLNTLLEKSQVYP